MGRISTAVGEGHAIERALFWGRCTGGAVILLLGPIVTTETPEVFLRALGVYFFAYAGLMLLLTSRARTERAQEQAAWLAHGFDTVGFLSALVLNATDPGWLAVYAAPLYVLVAVSRMGLLGGISAAAALAVAHVALALWRQDALGIPFDVARNLVHISIYGLAALLTTAIDSEMRALRSVRDRQALAEMERTRRLESLGALTGGIAHDLNNVLAVIRNDAYMAVAATHGRALRTQIDEIKDAAESGMSLTRQLLVFARGTRTGAPEPIDVRREIAYAERLLRRTIGPGIALDARIADDLPVVELEPGQLERILMNLVVNARDAMPGGGSVRVEARSAEVSAGEVTGLAAGRYLRIVVGDDGAGMPPEVAKHAFEPFFTTKGKGEGTGLGLWSLRGLARRVGGNVTLASTPGIGTTVTVHLPAVRDASAPVREPAVRHSSVEVA